MPYELVYEDTPCGNNILVSKLLKNGICNEEEIPDTIDIQSDFIINLDENMDNQVPVISMFTNTSTLTNTSIPILNEDMDDEDIDDQISVTSVFINTYILDKDIDVISTFTNTSTPTNIYTPGPRAIYE
ncbi:hypothetical protein Glove_84g174 [Diversispora epigaea]|uniref:Uncharacterized protein n=1 Tax=Diversispora epigaea TaxID=1348612 RepID=A0A397JBM0_9GLOM|nr:hypothetical protein Glove_84g174 [Diversispora epigaea]